jgi:2OG-Fe dioxygenase
VSDDSTRTPPGLDRVWAALRRQGYALTNDRAIGLPDKLRQDFRETYFSDSVLRHDAGDWPIDRKRARDVVRYRWRDGDLDLTEHGTITITDRAEIPGERDHTRVMLLGNPRAKELVRTLLHLVPAEHRQPDGTFGVNLFRTFTNVVSKLHRDDEQFVITYVLDRVGGGAETALYERDDVTGDGRPIADARPVLRHQLNPGEVIIFDDERFRHGATPLEAPTGEATQRDVLVCTVDYRETYLGASGAS